MLYTYDDVKRLGEQLEKLLGDLHDINQKTEEIAMSPKESVEITPLITNEQEHNKIIFVLRNITSLEKRLNFLDRQRKEVVFAIENLKTQMKKMLIPNHWYIFDHVAVINVVWFHHDSGIQLRIDYEEFDNAIDYMEENAAQLLPAEFIHENGDRTADVAEWAEWVARQ